MSYILTSKNQILASEFRSQPFKQIAVFPYAVPSIIPYPAQLLSSFAQILASFSRIQASMTEILVWNPNHEIIYSGTYIHAKVRNFQWVLIFFSILLIRAVHIWLRHIFHIGKLKCPHNFQKIIFLNLL